MNQKQPVSLDNLKTHQPYAWFEYPPEITLLDRLDKKKALLEIISFLVNEIMESGNPKSYIFALALAAGIDMRPVCKSNVESKIASQLGICQQSFNQQVNRLRKRYGFNRKQR